MFPVAWMSWLTSVLTTMSSVQTKWKWSTFPRHSRIRTPRYYYSNAHRVPFTRVCVRANEPKHLTGIQRYDPPCVCVLILVHGGYPALTGPIVVLVYLDRANRAQCWPSGPLCVQTFKLGGYRVKWNEWNIHAYAVCEIIYRKSLFPEFRVNFSLHQWTL